MVWDVGSSTWESADNLPLCGFWSGPVGTTCVTEMTAKLLGTLRDQKIPAVGFVNEKKLYKFGEVDERIKALASPL